MPEDDILARFAEVLRTTARVDRAQVKPDSRLREDLGLDSLSLIDLAVAAEDASGVPIPDEDLERFETVGDAVDYLRRVRAAA